jgi:MFS family permease
MFVGLSNYQTLGLNLMATKPATADADDTAQTAVPSRLPRMLQALRHRNFRLFFAGQLISLTGTWMQQVAQGWLVLRLTDSPALLGLVAAASSLPVLLFSLPAGTLVDRFPKQRILIVTQLVAMLLAGILAVLTLTGAVEVWHVLTLAALLGTVNAFDAPARQAMTVELVGRDDLLNAIALNASVFNAARTVGPAVAGLVVALIGEGPAFLINTLTFLPVLLGLVLMRLPPFIPPASGGRLQALRDGLRYIQRDEPRVRALLLQVGALSFFGFVHIPLMPVFARDVLNAGASGLGWLSAASGLGALIAALVLAQLPKEAPRGRIITIALFLHMPLMVAFTLSRSLPLAMLCMFGTGLAGVCSMALSNTLIQTIVPDGLRGRVMSVFTLLLLGMSPLGGMFAGVIAEAVGNVPLVVALSSFLGWLMIVTVNVRSPFVRRL